MLVPSLVLISKFLVIIEMIACINEHLIKLVDIRKPDSLYFNQYFKDNFNEKEVVMIFLDYSNVNFYFCGFSGRGTGKLAEEVTGFKD